MICRKCGVDLSSARPGGRRPPCETGRDGGGCLGCAIVLVVLVCALAWPVLKFLAVLKWLLN